MDYVAALALGFIVGLSGAMIPGPLLVYTINESMKGGWATGAKVILGHIAVEVAMIAAIITGIGVLLKEQAFIRATSLLGAVFMGAMAFSISKAELSLSKGKSEGKNVIFGGMMFTAFNPGFPLWWISAGTALLTESMRLWGIMGAIFVVFGHWIADMGYYTFVSVMISRGGKRLLKKHMRVLRAFLSICLLFIGAYFAWLAYHGT